MLEENDSSSNTEPIKPCCSCENKFKAFKRIFFEYSNECSVHGFKYIGEKKLPIIDRIIWICGIIFSIVTCCYLITIIWEKRNTTPVIVSFNEKQTPVWEIPFPSVTICPETKTHTTIFNYTEIYWKISDHGNLTKEEQYYWEAISQTCQPRVVSSSYGNIFANSSDLIKAITKAAPTLEETFAECHWKRSNINCEEIFDSILTEEGICFSFNSLKSSQYRTELYNSRKKDFIGNKYDTNQHLDWDQENGYNEQADADTFPVRALGAGAQESLIVFLTNRKEDEEQMCRNALQGFKVTLHTPGEEPQVSKKFVDIPFDQTVLLAVKPRLVTTSDGLRHYQPERRQCYYQNERYLRYFKVYNQVNCQLECLANQTLAKCGCVKFSMPRNSSHPVCGADSIKCMDDVIDHSSTMKFKLERNPIQFNNLSSFCHCLPTCIEIEYKAELEHQVAIDVVGTARAFREDRMGDDIWSTRVTQLSINFKADVFNGLKRSELYSWTDFIASCGGLLGLFMGISILSLVEFVYFFTIRLWRKLRQTRRKQRRLSKKKRSLKNDDISKEQSAKI